MISASLSDLFGVCFREPGCSCRTGSSMHYRFTGRLSEGHLPSMRLSMASVVHGSRDTTYMHGYPCQDSLHNVQCQLYCILQFGFGVKMGHLVIPASHS